MIQAIAQVKNPRLIWCIRFILICTDVIEFQAIHCISSVQRFFIPAIARTQAVFLADGKRLGNPSWFAPAEHIYRDIRIDRFCICCKLKACTSCYICRFICRTFAAWFSSGRRVNIRAQFDLNVSKSRTIVFLKQQAHDFLIGMGMLHLIIQQQAGGVVTGYTAKAAVRCGRVFVGLCTVCNNFHRRCRSALYQIRKIFIYQFIVF